MTRKSPDDPRAQRTRPRPAQTTRHVRDTGACRATRIRILLDLGRTFTRGQLADLMAQAARWGAEDAYEQGWHAGREHAEAEHSELMMDVLAAALTAPPFSEREVRTDLNRQRARREADAAAVHPWRGDYAGGSVAVPGWGDEGDT